MSREPQRRGLDVDIWERVGPPELRGKDPWEPLLLRVGESRAGGGDLGESPDTRAQAGPAHAWEETLASSSVVKVTLIPAAGHGLRDWRELEPSPSTDCSPDGEG